MKILVVSDIHANADALNAVFDAESGSCAGVFCLGDIVGYGPDAEACVSLIRSLDRSFESVMILGGNHEAALSGKLSEEWFNSAAQKSVRSMRRVLSADSIDWLSVLDSSASYNRTTLLSHGSPVQPLTGYLLGGFETDIAVSYLVDMGVSLCFCGHSHEASVFGASEFADFRFPAPGTVVPCGTGPLIVNPGSVGFPRSFNGARTADMPGEGLPVSERSFPAYYAVWDTGAETITFHDVRYDRRPVEQRIKKMK